MGFTASIPDIDESGNTCANPSSICARYAARGITLKTCVVPSRPRKPAGKILGRKFDKLSPKFVQFFLTNKMSHLGKIDSVCWGCLSKEWRANEDWKDDANMNEEWDDNSEMKTNEDEEKDAMNEDWKERDRDGQKNEWKEMGTQLSKGEWMSKTDSQKPDSTSPSAGSRPKNADSIWHRYPVQPNPFGYPVRGPISRLNRS